MLRTDERVIVDKFVIIPIDAYTFDEAAQKTKPYLLADIPLAPSNTAYIIRLQKKFNER